MTDFYEARQANRIEYAKEKKARRERASYEYDGASRICKCNHIELICFSDTHYRAKYVHNQSFIVLDIYPGKLRIINGLEQAPRLDLPDEWGLFDIVDAIVKIKGGEEMMKISTSLKDFRDGKPGIYTGIPFDDYKKLDACNNSGLTHLIRSPAHCKENRDNPKPSTAAQVIGNANHTMVLEPKLFEQRYAIAKPCEAIIKSGDCKGENCGSTGKYFMRGQWFCGKHGDEEQHEDNRVIIAENKYADMLGSRASLSRHKDANAIITHPEALYEVSAVANYTVCGEELLCKIRIDCWIPKLNMMADVKTTEDASKDSFEKSIWNFGYYRQAGFYTRIMRSLGFDVDGFVFIAVEKSSPYGVAAYRLKDGNGSKVYHDDDGDEYTIKDDGLDILEAGWLDLQAPMGLYAKCKKENRWPCYGQKIVDIGVPVWAERQLKNRIGN